MVSFRIALVAVALALLVHGSAAAGSVTSGPQVGDKVPGPFAPLNVNGPDAGKTSCQYCKNGSRPVVAIFVRQVTPAVVELLRKVDAATTAHKDQGLGSYVVVCNDTAGLDKQFAGLAQQLQLRSTVLALYKAGGPEKYHLAGDAEVTVLLYTEFTVKANHAFKAGEMTGPAVDAVLADIAKILGN